MDDESGELTQENYVTGIGRGESEIERLGSGWSREARSWFQDISNEDDIGGPARAKRWRASAARRLNRDKVMQIWRLGDWEEFVSERSLYSMGSVIVSFKYIKFATAQHHTSNDH